MLNMVDRQPELRLLLTTSRPKGASIKPAILKHCMPNGIPTIVSMSIMPPAQYMIALIRPPQTSQMTFPRKLNGAMIRLNKISLTQFLACHFHKLRYGLNYTAVQWL